MFNHALTFRQFDVWQCRKQFLFSSVIYWNVQCALNWNSHCTKCCVLRRKQPSRSPGFTEILRFSVVIAVVILLFVVRHYSVELPSKLMGFIVSGVAVCLIDSNIVWHFRFTNALKSHTILQSFLLSWIATLPVLQYVSRILSSLSFRAQIGTFIILSHINKFDFGKFAYQTHEKRTHSRVCSA